MIDGRVCNAITNNASSQRCYLCQVTSKYLNKVDELLQKEMAKSVLHFGLSILYA